MTKIAIDQLDRNLAEDVAGEDMSHYELHELPYEGATVANQHWQVLWHGGLGRAGVVFCGSGSSGHTTWTDCNSPEDAVRRVVEDEVMG